ncbi:MAG TPA: hypothetical protein VF303_00490 [Candidatus Nanoarchaeia archaeon]
MTQEPEIQSVFDLFRLIGSRKRLDLVEILFASHADRGWVSMVDIQISRERSGRKRRDEYALWKDLEVLAGKGVVEFDSRSRRWRLSWEKAWLIREANSRLQFVARLIYFSRSQAA